MTTKTASLWFSTADPAVQFYLNTYTTKGEILDTVRGLRHKGGRPLNTGAALQYLRDNVFTASAGSRRLEGVPQVLILLCGGKSFDSVDAPASALKQLGVLTFAIGTRSSDSRELQNISHDPSYALSVSEFTDLPSVQQQLQSSVEAVVIDVTPESPTVLVEKKPMGRDDVFLLDGSDGTRSGFPAMRDFVQRVVETLSVDDNKDRVSVVQYSRDPAVQFYLNTYTTKGEILDTVRVSNSSSSPPEAVVIDATQNHQLYLSSRDTEVDDNRPFQVQYSRDPAVQFYLNTYTTKGEILDTVRGLRHKGGRPLNTGAALQYLRDNVFTASAGSRRLEGVPQS
ncbi:uncharacterized protein AKAME5_000452200 [Lates japonicus]|uniref:VWFA domain-containing protein n=1 Tax=Lates japonicus TaxID=270547 RepID=A0AAD3MBS0_LATJO|nr:uncharacterized protein AKAME5_000452200 [Lates japonicus]